MCYKIELIKKDNFTINHWSGGTTTQLMIYPPLSSYADRNFLWRVSSASVDDEESTFTSLPDVSRILMVLKGYLRIEHLNEHTALLNPYDQDSFCGSFTTKSYGKATDFNLMTREHSFGFVEAHKISPTDKIAVHHFPDEVLSKRSELFYLSEGNCKVSISENEVYQLDSGDLLAIHFDSEICQMELSMQTEETQSMIVRASISY